MIHAKMKLMIKIGLIAIVTFFISCSAMKHNIRKNDKFTDNIISSVFKENGNVFYIRATHATFSTVWTYNDNKLIVYNLANGRIQEKSDYFDNGISDYQVPTFKELNLELKECGYELDGENFGFKIDSGEQLEQQDLPISIECFTQSKYNLAFLNKVVADINIHKIWDVRYE